MNYRANWVKRQTYLRLWTADKKAEDPEAFLAKAKASTRRWHQRLRAKMFEVLGGAICNRCGFEDMRALQIDHVNGDGAKERKALSGGSRNYNGSRFYHKVIREGRTHYQVLCANCNWIKRAENAELANLRKK